MKDALKVFWTAKHIEMIDRKVSCTSSLHFSWEANDKMIIQHQRLSPLQQYLLKRVAATPYAAAMHILCTCADHVCSCDAEKGPRALVERGLWTFDNAVCWPCAHVLTAACYFVWFRGCKCNSEKIAGWGTCARLAESKPPAHLRRWQWVWLKDWQRLSRDVLQVSTQGV